MRFSDRRLYIEAYVKCVTCGVLIYDDGIREEPADAAAQIYCSPWCREWAALKRKGGNPVLPLEPRRE